MYRGIQGHWSPDSYFFYNLVFILTIIWGIHSKEKEEPIQIVSILSLLYLSYKVSHHNIISDEDRKTKTPSAYSVIEIKVTRIDTMNLTGVIVMDGQQ